MANKIDEFEPEEGWKLSIINTRDSFEPSNDMNEKLEIKPWQKEILNRIKYATEKGWKISLYPPRFNKSFLVNNVEAQKRLNEILVIHRKEKLK